MRRWLLLLVALGSLGLLAQGVAPAYAQTQTANPDLDRQVREIASDLRCPVCQNLSVADSPSQLAAQMRDIIRQKLQAGESRQAIMQYFVDNYGQSILLNPPQQGFTLLVWLGAVAAVLGGAALLALRLRRALTPSSPGAPVGVSAQPQETANANDPYEAILDAELEYYKEGGRA